MGDNGVKPGVARIALHGELDFARAEGIVTAATEAMAADGVTRLVIDMSGVAFVDSTALGAFIAVHSHAREAGVEIALVEANHRVRRLLEVTRLGSFFATEAC